MALIGVIGAAKAQGADVDIPSLADARADFDEWLMSDDDDGGSDDHILKSALGLRTGA